MGRPPKTVEQHKLDGTYQKCRHADRGVSIKKVLALDCPKSLEGKTVDAWVSVVPDLCKANLVTLVDLPELEHAFICYQVAQNAMDQINEQGGIVEYYKKRTDFHSVDLYDIYLRSMNEWQKVLYKYGMTPVEAAKIRGAKLKETEEQQGLDAVQAIMGNG